MKCFFFILSQKGIYMRNHLYPSTSVSWSLPLSDFHRVGVSGPLQSADRPRDVMYFPKAITYESSASLFEAYPTCFVSLLLKILSVQTFFNPGQSWMVVGASAVLSSACLSTSSQKIDLYICAGLHWIFLSISSQKIDLGSLHLCWVALDIIVHIFSKDWCQIFTSVLGCYALR